MKRKIFIFLGLASLFVFALLSFYQINELFNLWAVNISYLVPPFLAVHCGLMAFFGFGAKSSRGQTLLLLSAGMIMLFVGEVVWTYNVVFLDKYPFPSIADFFYLLSFPLILLGLAWEFKTSKIIINKRSLLIFAFHSFLAICLTIFLSVYFLYDPMKSVSESLINNAYVIGDLAIILLLSGSIFFVKEYKGGKIFASWISILISFIMIFIADILFASFNDEYKSNLVITFLLDITWMLGYLFFAYGACQISRLVEDRGKSIVNKIEKII